jgi:hypothetical protein
MSNTTTRCYPPGGAATTVTVDPPYGPLTGASASANGSVDQSNADGSVDCLRALNWLVPAEAGSGTTAQRPPATNWKLKFYVDTTLGAFIWSDGAIWRTVAGAVA